MTGITAELYPAPIDASAPTGPELVRCHHPTTASADTQGSAATQTVQTMTTSARLRRDIRCNASSGRISRWLLLANDRWVGGQAGKR